MRITRVVSGGQTGVDRAALDVAIELGIQHGGWVPQGRTAEDGPIDQCYQLKQTTSVDAAQRTEWNVRDSDATLIVSRGQLTGGTELTQQMTRKYGRPHLHVDLSELSIPEAVRRVIQWLAPLQCSTLNVAGPRASEDTEIYQRARTLLRQILLYQPGTVSNGNLDAAFKVYEQTLSNFRHWDQIRWLVPYWYVTLATAVAALLGVVKKEHEVYVRLGLFIFGYFSFVCLYLLFKLMVYHNRQFRELRETLAALLTAGVIQDSLGRPLPFSFEVDCFPATATFWFMLLISCLGIVSVAFAIVGLP